MVSVENPAESVVIPGMLTIRWESTEAHLTADVETGGTEHILRI